MIALVLIIAAVDVGGLCMELCRSKKGKKKDQDLDKDKDDGFKITGVTDGQGGQTATPGGDVEMVNTPSKEKKRKTPKSTPHGRRQTTWGNLETPFFDHGSSSEESSDEPGETPFDSGLMESALFHSCI